MGDPRSRLRRVEVLILKARNASHGEVTVRPTLRNWMRRICRGGAGRWRSGGRMFVGGE